MSIMTEFLDCIEEITPFLCVLLPSYAVLCVFLGFQPSVKDAFLVCISAVPMKNIYDFFRKS
jgi:hypothetical protein